MSFKAIHENKILIFSSLSRHLLLRFVCERAGKALVRLDRCAGSHEPLLLVYCETLTFGGYFYLVLLAINRGSYMSAHVLLNLLNELGKRDKMRGLPSILSLFLNEFNKFNNTRARMLDSIYHMTNTLKSHFWRKNVMYATLLWT